MSNVTDFLEREQALDISQSLIVQAPAGSGKTELFYYIADKLNEPVYLLQVNGGFMPEMVEGKTSLAQGETVDEMGVVPHAYKHGGLILLDEVDKANIALQ